MTGGPPLVEDGVVAGNVYDKEGTRNPLARALLARFRAATLDLVALADARDVHEVGCGEGWMLARMAAPGRRLRGSDFSAQVVERARFELAGRGVDAELRVAGVEDLDPSRDAAELVACFEVLEHVEDPSAALERLASLARPWLLVSVPREPLWRMLNVLRGAYWRDFGNTPGHLNHWSRRAFLRFLDEHVDVIETRSPVPWTVALCRSRPSPPLEMAQAGAISCRA